MQEPRTAVYCATRNRYDQMEASAKSLLYNNGADRIVFLIEDDAFPNPLPDCVSVQNVSGQTIFPHDGPNYVSRFSYMVLLRTAFTKLFPDMHRVMSIDTDTIALKDAGGIWDYDMHNYYFSSVREMYDGIENDKPEPHFRIGVAILNLDKLRDGTDDKVISMVNSNHYGCPEQDAYCYACSGHILELPPEYNATWYGNNTVPESKAIIFHYSQFGPIESHAFYRKFARMPWSKVTERMTTL